MAPNRPSASRWRGRFCLSPSEPRIAVVGVPGGWSSENLADAVQARTAKRLLVDMNAVTADLGAGTVMFQDHDLTRFDAIIVKKIAAEYSPLALEKLDLLRFAQSRGVRVFSDPFRIASLLDRVSCTVTLAAHDIAMPDTVITENVDSALDALDRFEVTVLKPQFTTKARGMIVLGRDDAGARETLERFVDRHGLIYMQRKIKIPGHDLGVVFLGGDYLATYARVADPSSWSTSTKAGGRYAMAEPDAAVLDLAKRAQAPFGLDFTCVDVAVTDDGPVVFEVSAFGGFRGLMDACGINAAELYVDHVVKSLAELNSDAA